MLKRLKIECLERQRPRRQFMTDADEDVGAPIRRMGGASFAIPIVVRAIDGYRYAPPILRADLLPSPACGEGLKTESATF